MDLHFQFRQQTLSKFLHPCTSLKCSWDNRKMFSKLCAKDFFYSNKNGQKIDS